MEHGFFHKDKPRSDYVSHFETRQTLAPDTAAQFSSQQLWLAPQGPRHAESHFSEEG